jgi:DNA-binding IclR family transcriptional regulator
MMKPTEVNQRQFVQSLARGFIVLAKVCRSGTPLSLSELAKKSDLSIGAIQRLTYTLENIGLLERDRHTKRFRPGPRMISLALAVTGNLELKKVAHPFIQALSDEIGEVVGLGALQGDSIILMDIIHAQQPRQLLNINRNIGADIPPHATATGKAILAFLPDSRVEEILGSRGLPKFTTNTISSINSFKKELERVRAQGFATAFDENVYGLTTIGAPVKNCDGDVSAALIIMIPSMKISREKFISAYKKKVVQTADQISLAMGHLEEAD